MKTILVFSALLSVFTLTGRAEPGSRLREAKIPKVVEAAVPALKFSSGDPDWNGGMFSSNYAGGLSFDSNNCRSVYTSKADLTAGEIAVKVLETLADDFKLPRTKPSSLWTKKTADPENYGMAFLNCQPEGKPMNSLGGEYVTVEVSKLADGRYAISTTYVCLKNE